MELSRIQSYVSWAIQLVVVGILLQTLFFKFSGAEESKYIFSRLGMEPWGRIGTGVVELIACVLLLYSPTVAVGAILSLGVIGGAIAGHLTKLGVVVVNSDGTRDGGLLFALAIVVFVGSAVILSLRRGQIPVVGPSLVTSARAHPDRFSQSSVTPATPGESQYHAKRTLADGAASR